MFYLSVTDSFSAAHRLNGYEGPCSNMHGHNFKVRICVRTENQDKIGMSIDFSFLKKILSQIVKELDHCCLNEVEALKGKNPTSENLAIYIYESMAKALQDKSVSIYEVEICESERSSVIYKND